MPIPLEITLIVVLIGLFLAVLPLVFRLGRTLQGIDSFLFSAKKDVAQIADDVHASRVRMDLFAASLQRSLDDLAVFTHLMGEVAGTVKDLHTRFQDGLVSTSRNLGAILGVISAILDFFKHRQTHADPEKEPRP